MRFAIGLSDGNTVIFGVKSAATSCGMVKFTVIPATDDSTDLSPLPSAARCHCYSSHLLSRDVQGDLRVAGIGRNMTVFVSLLPLGSVASAVWTPKPCP